MKKLRSLEEFERLRKEVSKSRNPETVIIAISSGTCGQARGSLKIIQAFKKAVDKLPFKIKNRVSIRVTGCHGFCEAEPNVIIYPEGIFYQLGCR